VRRLAAGLDVRVEGVRRPLRAVDRELAFPKGVGGLRTTRLQVVFDAGELRGDDPVSVSLADRTFAGRIGWREIVVDAALDARIASASVPSVSVSDELRSYPEGRLQSPLNVREATASVVPGDRRGIAPSASGDDAARTAAEEGGFASLIAEEELGFGVVVLMLGAALFWGAAHALTPGHGKAIVAAYLVGTRGTPRHAVLLGLIVTVTHTIGVFALGIVTLALSELVVPEQLYPWLNLVSAVLVVLVGVTVLRVRLLDWLRPARRAHAHHHHGHHHHHHDHHDHGPGHHHHHHHHDGHAHGHSHVPEPGSGLRGLVAVGISGGLLPCPTALVVLLAAISLHRVALGLVLIVAFSIGLASVITGIGLLAISAKRVFSRMSFEGGLVRALPAVSAVVIVCLGLAMTVRALPTVV
jgi:nickel/cobalt transporter (NicO) family protein